MLSIKELRTLNALVHKAPVAELGFARAFLPTLKKIEDGIKLMESGAVLMLVSPEEQAAIEVLRNPPPIPPADATPASAHPPQGYAAEG